jgi:uncharacterized protein HemX
MQLWILLVLSAVELILFFLLLKFFRRLRRSEEMFARLQSDQDSLLEKLRLNAELEQELMHSFAERQEELHALNAKLEERARQISDLLAQAETVSRSPRFLRELILEGAKKGRSADQLARSTGLSLDEVRLIMEQGA